MTGLIGSIWGRSPTIGDWVVTLDERTPVTLSDRLWGGGVARGTRGVVVARHGRQAEVELGAGWGSVRATVPVSRLRTVRVGGGEAAFRDRQRLVGAIRCGIAGAFVVPVLVFAAEYLVAGGSVSGILPALASAVLVWAIEGLAAALAHPAQAILALLVTTVLARWAFRR